MILRVAFVSHETLLQINGTTLKEVKLPQKFLLEMMDLNEQIDDADDEVIKSSATINE